MAITIKTPEEIKIMRQAGKILADVLKKLARRATPGISSLELDKLAEKLILEAGAGLAFKGYRSQDKIYPASLCISTNNHVVHGIPHKNLILKNGDIVGLDCGLKYKGYFADMAVTLPIGRVSPQARRLIKVTRNALNLAIKKTKPGIHLGDISASIQDYVEKNGFSVVRQLSGHGIGKDLHEDPQILNFGTPGTGPVLKQGMTLCFEPMVNEGSWEVKTLDDGWTVVTVDGSLSAHFEHTILVTKKAAQILTQ